MRIKILAVGRLRPGPEQDLFKTYCCVHGADHDGDET